MMNLTSFLRLPWLLLFTTLKRLGRILIFMVPSAPQEKMWLAGPTSICMTPVPRFLKIDWRACSFGKVWRTHCVAKLQICRVQEQEEIHFNRDQKKEQRWRSSARCSRFIIQTYWIHPCALNLR